MLYEVITMRGYRLGTALVAALMVVACSSSDDQSSLEVVLDLRADGNLYHLRTDPDGGGGDRSKPERGRTWRVSGAHPHPHAS